MHAYFNYKIIAGMLHRLAEDKAMEIGKKMGKVENLNKMAIGLAARVLQDYEKDKKIYTSWNP